MEARKLHLLDEFFNNVCYAYFGWQLRLYYIQKAHLEKQANILDKNSSIESNERSRSMQMSHQTSTEYSMFPIKLTDEENWKMHKLTKRVHQGL